MTAGFYDPELVLSAGFYDPGPVVAAGSYLGSPRTSQDPQGCMKLSCAAQ